MEGMSGNSVTGILLGPLQAVGLQVLQKLNLGKAEASETLLKEI